MKNDFDEIVCEMASILKVVFTELFNKHKQSNRRYLRERNEPIQSFYFNNQWIKLLIFFSTFNLLSLTLCLEKT